MGSEGASQKLADIFKKYPEAKDSESADDVLDD